MSDKYYWLWREEKKKREKAEDRIKDDSGRVKELENSLSIALDNVDKYQRENKDLKDKIKEAGKINQLHQELCEKLKSELARAKEDHQYDNLVHQKELESLRK